MYNNKMKNFELPENLFSNLGELKSRQLALKNTPEEVQDSNPIPNDFPIENDIKMTNYTNRQEYRDRIDRMYEEIKGIKPIDNEIDNIIFFHSYVEKGIVVRPKVSSLKQFWTEYRLISNEKINNQRKEAQSHISKVNKELDNFDELFEALSKRVEEINQYIDELREIKININKTNQQLAQDKEKLANERSQFNSYKQKEENKIAQDKKNLKINFDRLQTIIDDLDRKLVSLDTQN